MMQIAKPGDQRDGVRLRMCSVILRRHSDAQQGPAQNVRQKFHLVNPPKLNFEIVLQDGGKLAGHNRPLQARPAYAKSERLPSSEKISMAKTPRVNFSRTVIA